MKTSGTVKRGSRQQSLPSAQPTEENNLYDSLSKVQEWKLGSVSALIPDVSADRVLKNGANTSGTFHSVHSTDFSGQDKELSSVYTWGECQWNSGTTSFSFLLLWKRNKLCQERDECLLLLYHHLFTFNPGKQKTDRFCVTISHRASFPKLIYHPAPLRGYEYYRNTDQRQNNYWEGTRKTGGGKTFL